LHGFSTDPGSRSTPGKTELRAQNNTGRPARGADETSIEPALDTAAVVAIVSMPLPCKALSGPKSLDRVTAVPKAAANAATGTGTL